MAQANKTLKALLLSTAMLLPLLAGCANGTSANRQADGTESDIVVTGSGRADVARPPSPLPPPPPAPPPAPPPPVGYAPQRQYAPAVMAPPQVPVPQTNTERYQDVEINPIKQVAEEPVSTFSIDVDTAAYANVRRFLTGGQLPPTDAVRAEELINYFDYNYPLPADRRTPFATHVHVVPSPFNAGREIVHIGIQGYDLIPAERPPLNLTLLIDTSGSMQAPNKLPLVKQSVEVLLEQLTSRDRVSIVVYAGSAGLILPPTPGDQRATISAALNRLEAGGSTAGGEGLALAYATARQNFNANSVNRVILASDGDFNVGIADPERLEDFVAEQRETGIYLTILGFGGQNYNEVMTQTLSQAGNGTAAYIDTLREANKVFSQEISRSLLPIADDVKIQVEFNPRQVAEYRLIGYETRMLRREDFNNDQVDAGEIGAGASVTALYEISRVGGPRSVDPLRYQAPTATGPATGELAFLRLRYKRPGEDASNLIERPITARDRVASLSAAPESTRFAVSVAGFAQLLRQDARLAADYDFTDVRQLAAGAVGQDRFGWRAEFLTLVDQAATLRAGTAPRPTPR